MNQSRENLLRGTLEVNGIFSGLAGLLMIAAARPLANLLGTGQPLPSIIVGGLSLLCAVGLLRNARRPKINLTEASFAVLLDVAWVIGSWWLMFAGMFSVTGNWIVAMVADVVLVFAVLQFLGLRKVRQAPSVESKPQPSAGGKVCSGFAQSLRFLHCQE